MKLIKNLPRPLSVRFRRPTVRPPLQEDQDIENKADEDDSLSFMDYSDGGGDLVGEADDASVEYIDTEFRDYQRLQEEKEEEEDFAPEAPTSAGGVPLDIEGNTRTGVTSAIAAMEQDSERYQFEVRTSSHRHIQSVSPPSFNTMTLCAGGQRSDDVHSSV